jgi:hypothetical protein
MLPNLPSAETHLYARFRYYCLTLPSTNNEIIQPDSLWCLQEFEVRAIYLTVSILFPILILSIHIPGTDPELAFQINIFFALFSGWKHMNAFNEYNNREMTVSLNPYEVWISHLREADRQEGTHIPAIRRKRPSPERVQTKPKRLFSASSAILDPKFPLIAWFVAFFYCSLGTLYAGIHTVGILFMYLFATTTGPR